jgi:hypothetical protein
MKAGGNRTEHSVGEIFRRWGGEYSRTHPLSRSQRRVLQTLAQCRTAALGGHLEKCDQCGLERPVYNSCGDRHCPTCQGKLAREWLAKRLDEVLNTPYFHCIFTLPEQFNALIPYNQRVMYELLFRATVQTLKSFARRRLGAELGIIAVLHTWGQVLWLHPHVHCIVTGGGLSFDRQRWVSTGSKFLFDVRELSAEFRKRFCALLRRADLRFEGEAAPLAEAGAFKALVDAQEKRDWVVHSKAPVRGPRQVLEYISRYTHRVAISNRRLLEVTEDGTVRFQYRDWRDRDYRDRPREKAMTLSAVEFIGRFLRHVLPCGFRKVRSYGLLAGRDKEQKLALCRALLGEVGAPPDVATVLPPLGEDPTRCPCCGYGPMRPVGQLHAVRAPPVVVPYQFRSAAHAA